MLAGVLAGALGAVLEASGFDALWELSLDDGFELVAAPSPDDEVELSFDVCAPLFFPPASFSERKSVT